MPLRPSRRGIRFIEKASQNSTARTRRRHGLHILRFRVYMKANSFRRASSPAKTRFAGLLAGLAQYRPQACIPRGAVAEEQRPVHRRTSGSGAGSSCRSGLLCRLHSGCLHQKREGKSRKPWVFWRVFGDFLRGAESYPRRSAEPLLFPVIERKFGTTTFPPCFRFDYASMVDTQIVSSSRTSRRTRTVSREVNMVMPFSTAQLRIATPSS